MSHNHKAVNHQANRGFTLVEIMVAISIFTVVATIAVSALLAANAVNRRAQAIKLAIDNVNYAIDSMTIKLKRGSGFTTPGLDPETIQFESPKDPLPGAPPQKSYQYKLEEDAGRGYIALTVGNGSPVRITSPDVDIEDLSFNVFGTDTGGLWGRVRIVIRGTATVGRDSSTFALQTTVSER